MNSGPEAGFWIHDLDPVIVRFTDTLAIRYYGLAYVLGFILAAVLLRLAWRAGRSPLDPERQEQALFAVIVGILAGGRIGYFLFYEPGSLLANPLALLAVWDGGMASHGGFLGGLLGLAWFSRRQAIALPRLTDLFISLSPPGILLGRVANFINGELWGRPTDVAWAVLFPQAPPARSGYEVWVAPWQRFADPRHPSQLYEAALEGFLLLVVFQLRFWLTPVVKRHPGRLTAEFLMLYAFVRIVGEQFREPDAGLLLGLSRGIFYSLFMLAAGAAWWGYTARRGRSGE